jgi:hypothetical protein
MAFHAARESLVIQRRIDGQINTGGCSGKAGENHREAVNNHVPGAHIVETATKAQPDPSLQETRIVNFSFGVGGSSISATIHPLVRECRSERRPSDKSLRDAFEVGL